jgi:hypothetical protein
MSYQLMFRAVVCSFSEIVGSALGPIFGSTVCAFFDMMGSTSSTVFSPAVPAACVFSDIVGSTFVMVFSSAVSAVFDILGPLVLTEIVTVCGFFNSVGTTLGTPSRSETPAVTQGSPISVLLKDRSVQLYVDLSTNTVWEIQCHLERVLGYSLDGMRLMSGSRQLRQDSTLADCGVCANHRLSLSGRLLGGAKEKKVWYRGKQYNVRGPLRAFQGIRRGAWVRLPGSFQHHSSTGHLLGLPREQQQELVRAGFSTDDFRIVCTECEHPGKHGTGCGCDPEHANFSSKLERARAQELASAQLRAASRVTPSATPSIPSAAAAAAGFVGSVPTGYCGAGNFPLPDSIVHAMCAVYDEVPVVPTPSSRFVEEEEFTPAVPAEPDSSDEVVDTDSSSEEESDDEEAPDGVALSGPYPFVPNGGEPAASPFDHDSEDEELENDADADSDAGHDTDDGLDCDSEDGDDDTTNRGPICAKVTELQRALSENTHGDQIEKCKLHFPSTVELDTMGEYSAFDHAHAGGRYRYFDPRLYPEHLIGSGKPGSKLQCMGEIMGGSGCCGKHLVSFFSVIFIPKSKKKKMPRIFLWVCKPSQTTIWVCTTVTNSGFLGKKSSFGFSFLTSQVYVLYLPKVECFRNESSIPSFFRSF